MLKFRTVISIFISSKLISFFFSLFDYSFQFLNRCIWCFLTFFQKCWCVILRTCLFQFLIYCFIDFFLPHINRELWKQLLDSLFTSLGILFQFEWILSVVLSFYVVIFWIWKDDWIKDIKDLFKLIVIVRFIDFIWVLFFFWRVKWIFLWFFWFFWHY